MLGKRRNVTIDREFEGEKSKRGGPIATLTATTDNKSLSGVGLVNIKLVLIGQAENLV